MRTHTFILLAIAWLTAMHAACAQEVLYRCETADGISIQGLPCPKGANQRKIAVPKTAAPAPSSSDTISPITASEPAPLAAPATPTSPLAAPASKPGIHWVPVTDDALMRGPNDPYPLWQCMRADGSTYDSRDGVAGKQWVPTTQRAEDEANPEVSPTPPKVSALPKGPILRAIPQTVSVADDTQAHDLGPPPPGAPAGQWVADQCQRLEPAQACQRYAARRDALRKQIYAARPSERVSYAPEEQDLTRMLSTACGM